MFVKICGLTDAAAVEAAVDAGADAIGFVFAASPREIEPALAAALCRDVPAAVTRVAVMHHPTQARLDRVLDDFGPDWIQTDAADFDTLKLPASIERLPVYREVMEPLDRTLPPRLLFEGRVSGSGTTADWSAAGRLARETELILAGGLDTENVGEAITIVQPFGVDVSSGVESTRGRKDPRRIREFVARVRAEEFDR